MIDANWCFITPGFTDSHIHFLMGGERLNSVKLKNANTQQKFMEALASYANSIEPGKWITGGDWDSYEWGCDLPDRHLIDSVTPNNPVWIGRHEGHMYLANTLALTLAGLLDKEI